MLEEKPSEKTWWKKLFAFYLSGTWLSAIAFAVSAAALAELLTGGQKVGNEWVVVPVLPLMLPLILKIFPMLARFVHKRLGS